MLARIEKATYRQRVYNELKSSITIGKLRPGQAISLKNLSEEFGVSIIPIREALFQLESEKIIVSGSKKGLSVSLLSPEEFSELMGIRLTLESQLICKSCLDHPESAVEDVAPIFARLVKAVNNPLKYITTNWEFHLILYSFARLPNTIDIVENLWARVGPYIFIYTERTGRIRSIDFHKGMFEAFRDRDEKKILRCLQADLDNSKQEILKYFETADIN